VVLAWFWRGFDVVWFVGLWCVWCVHAQQLDPTLTSHHPSPPTHTLENHPGGRVVEPGIKGFWRCYANIQNLMATELRSELASRGGGDPLTQYTRSGFWTPGGLEVRLLCGCMTILGSRVLVTSAPTTIQATRHPRPTDRPTDPPTI